jgi:predicted metal-dependent phosphoesterase TrpH
MLQENLIEIHCHTKEHSPCSEIGACDLVTRAVDKGLEGVVLTDHHYLWSEDQLQNLRKVSCCPNYFVIRSGQEVTTRDYDDVLVYGATETFSMGVSLGHIRSKAPEAAIVWPHPYRGIKRPGPDKLFAPELDGVEIFNRNHRLSQNIFAYKEWLSWGFVATAGPNVHDEVIGVFPCAFDDEITSIHDLSLAIKNGRCRPFTKTLAID